MISAVGHDAATSCASLRAGVSRSRGLQFFPILDVEEQEPMPLPACPVHGFTEGFQGLGLWVRLAGAAIGDLISSSSTPPEMVSGFWQETALLMITPILDKPRFEGAEWTPTSLLHDYSLAVAHLCRLPLCTDLAEIIPAGHAGSAVAIERASELLGNGYSRVLIVAADSYLDTSALEWLDALGRLKTPDNSAGLIAGEAAASVLLESASSVRRRNGRSFATVHRSATAWEQNHYLSNNRSQGKALASVIEIALEQPTDSVFSGDLISDMNGEEWRAYELGCTRIRLRSQLASTRILYPATSFGEIGAASGIAALCVAARSFERSYASGGGTLVTNSSDNGLVGAIYLTC